MPRFFTETINENKGIISGDDAKHIAKVLRMHAGEKLVACDCQGYDYDCVIESLDDKKEYIKAIYLSPWLFNLNAECIM